MRVALFEHTCPQLFFAKWVHWRPTETENTKYDERMITDDSLINTVKAIWLGIMASIYLPIMTCG